MFGISDCLCIVTNAVIKQIFRMLFYRCVVYIVIVFQFRRESLGCLLGPTPKRHKFGGRTTYMDAFAPQVTTSSPSTYS